MPRGRHRPNRPAGTVLPSGKVQPADWASGAGKAKTGKSSAGVTGRNKQVIYRHPLPLPYVPHEDAKAFAEKDRKQRARFQARHHSSEDSGAGAKGSWSEWLSNLVPGFLLPLMQSDEPPLLTTAQYDSITSSAWVTDPESAQTLWRRGFFGKGSLSRSEPTWHERRTATMLIVEQRKRLEAKAEAAAARAAASGLSEEERAAAVNAARQEASKLITAEELTAIRRKERQAAKIERAKAAVRAGTQLPDGILALGAELDGDEELQELLRKATRMGLKEGDEAADEEYRAHVPGLIYFREPALEKAKQFKAEAPTQSTFTTEPEKQQADAAAAEKEEDEEEPIEIELEEVEHVQLTMPEVFFLAGMLGVLRLVDEEVSILPVSLDVPTAEPFHSRAGLGALNARDLRPLLAIKSAHPASFDPFGRAATRQPFPDRLHCLSSLPQLGLGRQAGHQVLCRLPALQARASLWTCRVSTHLIESPDEADIVYSDRFAILVIPSYEDETDREGSPFPPHPNAGPMDWVRFSSVNRVNTQVLKTLILCHVNIPSVKRCAEQGLLDSPEALVAGLKAGNSFTINEVAIRRWVPARMRV